MNHEDYKVIKAVAKWATRQTAGTDKEDQEQEVIIRLWRVRDRVRAGATPAERLTYYRTVARNCVISAYRREWSQRGYEPYYKTRRAPTDPEPTVGLSEMRGSPTLGSSFRTEESFCTAGIHDLGEFLDNLYSTIRGRLSADEARARVLRDAVQTRDGKAKRDCFDGKTRVNLTRELARIAETVDPEFEPTVRQLSPQQLVDLLSVSTGWNPAEQTQAAL